eukprot:637088-Prorocentrum_minimum.AAC.1
MGLLCERRSIDADLNAPDWLTTNLSPPDWATWADGTGRATNTITTWGTSLASTRDSTAPS